MEPIVLRPFLGESSCWYSPNPAFFRGQVLPENREPISVERASGMGAGPRD